MHAPARAAARPASTPRLVSTALLGAGLLACFGYVPLGRPPGLGDARDIEIRMFANRTAEPGVERLLADALQEEFLRRGVLAPRYSGGASGALVLDGQIREVRVQPTAFSSVALALEDRLELVIEVAITRAGEVVWASDGLSEGERFPASADPQVYETAKEQALRRIAAGLAARIHDELYQAR